MYSLKNRTPESVKKKKKTKEKPDVTWKKGTDGLK